LQLYVEMVASILVVEKNGTVKETTYKSETLDDLYKKAGLKAATGFAQYAEWDVVLPNKKEYSIAVYGKTTGRANQENKYEFPPPIDNTLFFGNCVIVNVKDGALSSLTSKEWDTIYDQLYGGFEDIGDEEEDESEEGADDLPRTKSGYVKDDFVVDDDEEEDEEEHDEEELMETKPARKTRKPRAKTTNTSNKKVCVEKTLVNNWTKTNETIFDCMSELSEEEYI
jgi:hypothetical protein